MATLTKIPDETPVKEIVSTPRAQKHLVAAGCVTLGDVRAKGISSLVGMRYVGDKTIDELRAAIGPQGPVAAAPSLSEEEEEEYEENGQPVILERIPGGPSHISWVPARKTPMGIQESIFIEFSGKHRASVSARMFFMRKFRRVLAKVDSAIDNDRPWRNDCVALLRRSAHHRTGFIILTD